MTGDEIEVNVPAAVVRKRKGPSAIWIVPIIAALVGGYLWIEALRNMGPTVTLNFADAEGLKAGKTVVKFKDVQVGMVDSIAINDDRSGVIVKASLEKSMERHLGSESLFWVVRPRIDADGITGLATLLSGAFIAVKPESSDVDESSGDMKPTLVFAGLESPPLERSDLPGLALMLRSEELTSVAKGAPIFYHGIDAGMVTDFALAEDGQSVELDIWVKQPFVRYVHSNTRFWLKPLIDFSASADGVDFSLGSFRTLLSGGIAFGTDPADDKGGLAHPGDSYSLYASFEASGDEFTDTEQFVMFFDEPVRGLSVGAPVEFNGIKVGRVVSFRLEFDPQSDEFFVPVFVEIEARRIRRRGDSPVDGRKVIDGLLSKGLRARLETGTLLTGAKYVDLALLPELPAVLKGHHSDVVELPTVRSTFAAMMDTVKDLAEVADLTEVKARAVELIDSMRLTSESLRQQIDSSEVEQIKDDVVVLLEKLSTLTEKVDQAVDPAMDRLDALTKRGEEVLVAVDSLLGEVSHLTASDSRLSWLVNETLQELAASARSLRVLTDYLERHPEALLSGKAGGGGN